MDDSHAANLDQRFWHDELGDSDRCPRWIRIFQELSSDVEKGFGLAEQADVVRVDFNHITSTGFGLGQSHRDISKYFSDLILGVVGELAVGRLSGVPSHPHRVAEAFVDCLFKAAPSW